MHIVRLREFVIYIIGCFVCGLMYVWELWYSLCILIWHRLHYLWREEAVHTGQAGLSFFTVMWRFVRTRIIIAVLIYTLGLAFSILGHVRRIFKLTSSSISISNFTIFKHMTSCLISWLILASFLLQKPLIQDVFLLCDLSELVIFKWMHEILYNLWR